MYVTKSKCKSDCTCSKWPHSKMGRKTWIVQMRIMESLLSETAVPLHSSLELERAWARDGQSLYKVVYLDCWVWKAGPPIPMLERCEGEGVSDAVDGLTSSDAFIHTDMCDVCFCPVVWERPDIQLAPLPAHAEMTKPFQVNELQSLKLLFTSLCWLVKDQIQKFKENQLFCCSLDQRQQKQ